jgi:hypothetical protein
VFAVNDEVEYVPVGGVGDQGVGVRGDGAEGVLLCHASAVLGDPHVEVGRVLVVVHGALRNSGDYLGHAEHAVRLSGVGADTVSVAPQFLADVDARSGLRVPDRALYWDVDGWKSGQPSCGVVGISSFTAMDCLLNELVEAIWPDTGSRQDRVVVIVGNSAGGQFVNRYAVVGRGPDMLAADRIAVRFVIANPSSYLYFTPERPVTVPGESAVNRWRYGFDDPPAYVNGNPRQYLEQYLNRDVSIVVGGEDRDPAALLLEVGGPAMAQGASRLERAIHYDKHIRDVASTAGLRARHKLITLPGVGHDARNVLAAGQTRDVLFS